jgi:purine-binding chemotaxis protein CheW
MSAESHVTQVLRERARLLARRERIPATGETLELLEIRLASERYAVETRFVSEVQPLRDLTPLPGTPPFVRGIANLRGRILAVYDLKKLFELPEPGLTDLHRIVVVRGNDFEIGLLADTVIGVKSVPVDALAPPPGTVSGIGAQYLRGVTAECLVVLDLDRILADPRIVLNDGDSE